MGHQEELLLGDVDIEGGVVAACVSHLHVLLQDELGGQGGLELDPGVAGLVFNSTGGQEDVRGSEVVAALNVRLETGGWRNRNKTNLGTFLILRLHDPQSGQLLLHTVNGLKHVLVFNFLQFF